MYPQAYIDYLVHFHGDRDYFECHEILEEYWKSLPQRDRSHVWVGLIQIAVSLYHQRRGNVSGAVKMMQSALSILQGHREELARLGLEADELFPLLATALERMKQAAPYQSINLPIADDNLLQQCRRLCADAGSLFGQESDLNDSFLLHKHKLRDRSDVLAERERQLNIKRGRRGET
jgi:predicted metal-dependent hydrolase